MDLTGSERSLRFRFVCRFIFTCLSAWSTTSLAVQTCAGYGRLSTSTRSQQAPLLAVTMLLRYEIVELKDPAH